MSFVEKNRWKLRKTRFFRVFSKFFKNYGAYPKNCLRFLISAPVRSLWWFNRKNWTILKFIHKKPRRVRAAPNRNFRSPYCAQLEALPYPNYRASLKVCLFLTVRGVLWSLEKSSLKFINEKCERRIHLHLHF